MIWSMLRLVTRCLARLEVMVLNAGAGLVCNQYEENVKSKLQDGWLFEQ